MTIKNVAIIGANGRLGPSVLKAFLSPGSFNVTVLSRKSSKSRYPEIVNVVTISDEPSDEEWTRVLESQDAVVVTTAGSNSDLQIRMADAAAKAGVKRFIPADFGSCDSTNSRALELNPLYSEKQRVLSHLKQLASSSGLTWTSLVCGHFFDYGMKSGLLKFDLKARKAVIFDDGDRKWSATNLDTIGTATVRVMQREDETRNRMLYIQSVCTTQNDILRSLKQSTGKDWQVEHIASEEYIKQAKAEVDKNPDDYDVMDDLVAILGMLDTNWEQRKDFANPLLGLENENLDKVIERIVQE